MKKHGSLIKRTIITLVIILSALGVWRSFTSPSFAGFLVDLREVLAQTNLPLFCLAVGVYLLSIPLAVLSWNAILKMFERQVPVIRLIPILMAGVFINNTTPMSRAGGEIVRVYGLRERFKLPYTIAILSVVLSKLTEVIPIGLMGIIGAFVLARHRIISWEQLRFIGAIGCFVVGVATWGIYKKRCSTLWSKFLDYLIRKERQLSGEHPTIEEVTWSIKQRRAFGESLLFASALWTLALVRLKVLAYALGIDLSLGMAAAVIVWYIAIGFLAFTPGGIGIIEGGLVAGFVLMGIPPSRAFALTILERAISYMLSTGIGAICLFSLGGRELWAKGPNK
jgi:hypothetical protein